MITYVRTDIFESNAQVLVNTVNTVGVMGKGLAKEFKRLYPEMFEAYQHYCEKGQLTIGKLQIYRTPNKWILNFPTKKSWRYPSKIEYIEAGLKKFVGNYEKLGIQSISFPMLGCGNGGLDWQEVKPLMERYLKNLPIDVYVHISKKDGLAPEHKNQKEIEVWLKSEPQYLSSIEFISHLNQRFSGLINSVHKLGMTIDVTVEKIDDEESFCLKKGKTQIYLTRSTLAAIWHLLRNGGFLRKEMLSSELAEHADMVMAFLSELDYIALTQVGEEEDESAVRLLAYKQPVSKDGEPDKFVA